MFLLVLREKEEARGIVRGVTFIIIAISSRSSSSRSRSSSNSRHS